MPPSHHARTAGSPPRRASSHRARSTAHESAGHRENNLDALRLLAAAAVILGHAYHLLGRGAENPTALGFSIQTLGVVVFFSISGYLITQSWERSRSLVSYGAARVLRIFPGLVLVTLSSVLILGPLVTTRSSADYWHDPATWSYLSNIWLKPNYGLPGVFETLPYPGAVNGSLWTLPAEFLCYLLVPMVLMRRTRLAGGGAVAVSLIVSIWLFQVPASDSAVVWGNRISDDAQMWTFFAAGALIRLAHGRWQRFVRLDVAAALFVAYLSVLVVWGAFAIQVAWIFLPYGILAVGLASTPYVRRAARFGDFSYGLYLWGFPLQQLLVYLVGPIRLAVDVPIVIGASLAFAWASWHLVEQPSMRLRRRLQPARRPVGASALRPQNGPSVLS